MLSTPRAPDQLAERKSTMSKSLKALIVCAGLGVAVSASAQQGDVAYCSALAEKYQRYVGADDWSRRGQQRDARVEAVIGQCPTNSASAIPVLEQALGNSRIDLPPRG
jgi:hypothetical protein